MNKQDDAPELVTPNTGVAPEVRTMKLEEKQMLHQLCSVMQQTMGPWRQHMLEQDAQPNADMLLAAAVATYLGTLIGETVAVGNIAELALPRTLEVLRKNIDVGIDLGRKHVVRVAEQVMAEDAKAQGTDQLQ